MEIRRFVSDLLDSNMYLLREGDHCLVIDPCRNTAPAEGLSVDKLLLTHEHYDHISGVNVWKALTGARVLCTEACARNIRDPKKNLSRIFPAFCELQTWLRLDALPEVDLSYSCEAEEIFPDESVFYWRGHTLRLFTLPGHSEGGMGILLDDACLFSGDSLMEDSEVELRLPGGSRAAWKEVSIPRLSDLPEGITVYPGHFAPFAYEKKL